MSEILNPERVEFVFGDCLFKVGEDTTNRIVVDGVQVSNAFNPERLASHTREIIAMLGELPDQFKLSSGGGWSFLNACNDKHGNQWTGFHPVMDQLFQLGMGIGKVLEHDHRVWWRAWGG